MRCKTLRRIVAFCLCCIIVTVSAFAANIIKKTITVQYSGIKLVVDGVQVVPKDSNGNIVEPFIYNGTTYLPVRAVGNSIGKQVNWDSNTQTVYIGDNLGQSVYLMDTCPPYESDLCYDQNKTFRMCGENYGHGFTMDNRYGWALFNLNGNYQTIEFDWGHKDNSSMTSGTYEIYLDGKLIDTIKMEATDMVRHYTLQLNNALQMKIVGADSTDAWYGFANITLR